MRSTAAATLEVRPVTRLFKALGDETRVRIVALLTHGKLCVCHLEAALALPQPTVSRQLAVLRNAGVVEATRKGQWIYYGLAEQRYPDCKQQLRTLVRGFAKRTVLRQDVERLLKERGPGACE